MAWHGKERKVFFKPVQFFLSNSLSPTAGFCLAVVVATAALDVAVVSCVVRFVCVCVCVCVTVNCRQKFLAVGCSSIERGREIHCVVLL